MGCCISRHEADSSNHNSPYTSASSSNNNRAHVFGGESTHAIIVNNAHNGSSSNAPSAAALPHAQSSQSIATTSIRGSGVGAGSSPQISSRRRSGLSPEYNSETATSSRSRRTPLPLAQHFTLPLRAHPPYNTKFRLWTRSQIERERREFFETTVTGRPEIWAALRTVTELMRAGDIVTAQTILDAAGITVPTGDLVAGSYDEAGALYRIPDVVVADPENIVGEDDEDDENTSLAKDVDVDIDDEAEGGRGVPNTKSTAIATAATMTDSASEAEVPYNKEKSKSAYPTDKGKGSERDSVKVKARLSDRGGPDIVVLLGRGESVGVLARRIRSEASIPNSSRIRIAYLGKMLKETKPLLAQGWKEGNVLNALVALPLEGQ